MKLLAVSLPRHDMNVCYFDGTKLRYVKIERLKELKRYACWDYKTDMVDVYSWKYEIENALDIDIEEVDEIVFDFHLETLYKNPCKDLEEVQQGKRNYCKIPEENNVFHNYINNENIYYISHHYAHALSTWMIADNPDVCITIDGEGDRRTWSVYKGNNFIDGGKIEDGSIGGCMVKMADSLGIKGQFNDLAGKLMSFVSYGKINKDYLQILQQYNYRKIDTIFSKKLWIDFVGDELLAYHRLLDWAATVHYYIGEVLVDMFKQFANPNDTISYAGGVAQNIVWNTRLKKEFPNLIIPPHCGDEGLSLGAIELLRRKNNLPKFQIEKFPYVQADVKPKNLAGYDIIKDTAKELASGKIVLWYQENGEVGPRALGNRSILMDPRLCDGKGKINKIKNRENFRPFGATVLAEYQNTICDADWKDEYMLYTTNLTDSNLLSIRHIDGTCRLQTIRKDSSSSLRKLLEEFYKITGCPCLLNTSLNISGKPIAGYPDIALKMFEDMSAIDLAVVGNQMHIRR